MGFAASATERRSQPSSRAAVGRVGRFLPRVLAATAAVLAVGAAGALAFTLRSTVLSHAVIADAEWDRATEVLAVGRLGAHAVPGWIDFASLQLTAYTWISGALDRYADAVLAGREAALAVLIATCLVVLALCRRLRLGWPSSVAAALVTGIGPYAAGIAPTVSAGVPAALWLMLCCLLATRPRARIDDVILASTAGVIAILTAPIVAAVAFAGLGHAISSGGIGVRWGPTARRLTSVGAALGALVVIIGVVWVGGHANKPLSFDWSPGRWMAWTAVAVAILLAAVTARWLRTAAWALTILVAAAFLSGPVGPDALIVAVPAATVLATAALAELRTARTTTAAGPPPLAHVTRWVGLGLTGAVTATMLVGAASAAPHAVPHPVAETISAWLAAHTPPSSTVLVSSRHWAQLVAAGTPSQQLLSVDGLGTGQPPAVADLARIDYVVLPPSLDPSWSGLAGVLDGRTLPLAVLDDDADAVTIAALVPDAAVAQAELDAGRDQRADLGTALAASPALELSAPAEAMLQAGDVDGRLLTVLPLILADRPLSVAAFEHAPGEAATAAPARTVLITAVDGVPVQDHPAGADVLAEIFHAQQSPFRPLDVAIAADGVRVVYPSPSPSGLPSG